MRQRLRWLGLGLSTVGINYATYVVLVRTRPGQWVDEKLTGATVTAFTGALREALGALARPLMLYVLAIAAAGLVVLAIARHRWTAAFAAVLAAVVPAPVSLYLRGDLLARPELGVSGYAYNTFPSTHAAAAFGLLAATLLAWPRTADRGDVSRASFLAALILVGNVASQAHRAADVLGSVLLVASTTWLIVALVGLTPGRPTRQRARRRSAPR